MFSVSKSDHGSRFRTYQAKKACAMMDTGPNKPVKRILMEVEWEHTNSVYDRNCAARPSEARKNRWIPPSLNQDMPCVMSEEKCLGRVDNKKSVNCSNSLQHDHDDSRIGSYQLLSKTTALLETKFGIYLKNIVSEDGG